MSVGVGACFLIYTSPDYFLVQACCRSLIVDTLPIPSQQAGSAWGMVLPHVSV